MHMYGQENILDHPNLEIQVKIDYQASLKVRRNAKKSSACLQASAAMEKKLIQEAGSSAVAEGTEDGSQKEFGVEY